MLHGSLYTPATTKRLSITRFWIHQTYQRVPLPTKWSVTVHQERHSIHRQGWQRRNHSRDAVLENRIPKDQNETHPTTLAPLTPGIDFIRVCPCALWLRLQISRLPNCAKSLCTTASDFSTWWLHLRGNMCSSSGTTCFFQLTQSIAILPWF